MARSRVLMSVLLAGLCVSVASPAEEKGSGGEAQPAAQGQEGPRRDPQGIKGISPFWESVKKGDNAFIARDYDGALSAYREALKHEPQNAMGHYRMGETHLAKGELKEAEAAWQTARRFVGQDHSLKAKILFVLADLKERERSLNEASNGWNAYEAHAKSQPSAKTYPATPTDRKKRISEWKELVEQYAAVKERIKKRLEEADKKAKGG